MFKRLSIIAAYLVFVAGLSGLVWWLAYGTALDQLERRGQADLALAADRLVSELQRTRELAVFLADHPAVVPMVQGTETEAGRAALLAVADTTGALDIVVVDADGHEVGAARGGAALFHAGRPYFDRAMDGALGVAHLVSEAYGRRAFVFAAPVFSDAGPAMGAVLVYADVEGVEASWRGDRPTVFFTDTLGVVFVSNRSELILRSRSGDVTAAAQSAEYAAGQVAPFVAYDVLYRGPHDIWQVDGGRYLPARALHLTLPLPVIDMVAEALLDVAPARELARLQTALTAALCLALGALLFLATERRRTLALANARLEVRVAARTEELQQANANLRREVAERIEAEAKLTKAQADLVQAGKLSALGQMSAGISHELNQPLMAIRSFAENAEAFMARGQSDRAAVNLSRISELARRMGRIIRNLRAFARQESEPLADVDLVAVVEAAVEMVTSKARQAEVAVLWHPPPYPVMVRGGEVRLQQVVLNLLSNAIDAMDGVPRREVAVTIDPAADKVALSVTDTGPGISEPERIFDPFYTTKQVSPSEGMGLGLSISYGLVQSFGGSIQGRNRPEGGAMFTVTLDRVAGARAA